MERKRKRRSIIFTVMSAAILFAVVLTGVIYFNKYLQKQIFLERTTQLVEITSQVRTNVDNALEAHWTYLTAAVNALKNRKFDGVDDAAKYIGELETLLETESFDARLMLLDSIGNCYDADGKHGIWPAISKISGGADRYTFISDIYIYDGIYWTFVQKLDTPPETESDDVSFTYAVLLKDVQSLSEYYDSAAYGNSNDTYILKSDGTRMNDDISGDNIIHTYNVIKALEEMEGQSIPDIKSVLSERHTISTNFRYNGEEYYYCLTSLRKYDTLILFLLPADYVASGTVGMVKAVIRLMLFLGGTILLMMILVVISVIRQRNGAVRLQQEQENLHRQEEYNAMLAQSKEAVEQAFQIAEEANRAKGSFLSNMSHDIRTPMNAIVGFATLLTRDAANPDKVREYTKKITASGQHLLGLINDILDISKIEAGKTTLNMSDENIVNLIENIDDIIRPQMKAKGHIFEVYNMGLKHEHVVIDKLRLNQILLNILSNAVKYTPDGGYVTLTLEEMPQHTKQLAQFRFIIEDNGYGMSEEYVKKIFNAFTREEDSITNKIQGTGLGMTITKNLVNLMGGDISVESQKGKGSKFTVDLEVQISEQEIERDFWQKNGITRILTVDDEEVICKNIQITMENTGVNVEYALDGHTAIDMVKQSERENNLYNVVLLDWKMPGMDGVETARRIRREIPRDIPILVLTGYDWMEIEDEAREAGVDAFIPKPFFLTNFRQKVDAVISHEIEGETGDTGNRSVLQGMNILVAEDNEINAEILSELLSMSGAACDIYENGRLAVEAFEKSVAGQYGLILMDVQMPVMNGYEATRVIRELNHPLANTVPIIAMTANAFAEDIRDALESGMNGHVSKPIDMSVLERTVKEVLESAAGDA